MNSYERSVKTLLEVSLESMLAKVRSHQSEGYTLMNGLALIGER